MQNSNPLITQQEILTTELLTPTSENRCKRRNKNVIQTENNIHQEEITAKPGMSKGNKLPLKKSVYSNSSNRNKTSQLETEECPTENENTRTDSPDIKILQNKM